MRSEQEMRDLIINTAREDERVRAVIMNGSRTNPNAPVDIFQDFDIVYIVDDISSFKSDPNWINCFGELMILQLPDNMDDPPPSDGDHYTYLMQFSDGNRIDLGIIPIAKLHELERDSLSLLLLDKDGIIEPFPPANESDYLPKPPTAIQYADCCNEFWWVCPYVAKGLWREEITYAKFMLDRFVRDQLMKMLTWYIGVKTNFVKNPGKFGKYFKNYLEPELWEMLLSSYADASYENNWGALFRMGELFRITALQVAKHFNYDYPAGDDERVSAHLRHVKTLPKNAKELY